MINKKRESNIKQVNYCFLRHTHTHTRARARARYFTDMIL